MAAQEQSDLFMSVRLEDSRRICKVSVSSQTTGQSVIDLLKPDDDDSVYYLVEIWKGCERPITHEEKLKNVLTQWGSDVDDVAFVLKRKVSSRENHAQKHGKSPRNSPVPDQFEEKQQKVESLEKELQQKQKHLKSLRNKETSKNSLKTKYVRLLETRVIEQEEKLSSLYSVQDELFKYRVENEKLVLELSRLRSMFALKHQQLAEATARVELLSRELARTSQQQDIPNDNVSTLERNAQYPPYNKSCPPSDVQRRQLVNNQGQRLTEAQLLQLQAKSGYVTSTGNSYGQPYRGRDILFLKQGILHENDDLNSLLSWQNDDENDTETSADSGHVSNDSPPYQNKLGPNFQFYPDPPEMYCAKIERFDIDQEFGGEVTHANKNQGVVGPGTQDLRGLSEVDGWPQLQQRYIPHSKSTALYGNSDHRQNHKQQMFVNTDPQPGGVGLLLKQQQLNCDSPQSTSSLSSLSSESSKIDRQSVSFPGIRSSIPSNVRNGNDLQSKPSSSDHVISYSGHVISSADHVIANTGTHSGKSNRNPGSQTSTPTDEPKPFVPNESPSDARDSSASRTAGSISHYQRHRENSIDNSNPLPLGQFINERRASQTSDSSSGSSSYRVRTPSIERPSVPNTLMIPKASDSKTAHLSPTITGSNVASKLNQKNQGYCDSPTLKSRSKTPPMNTTVVQNGRSSPMVLDLTAQNTKNSTQQNLDRKSPLSKEQLVPGQKDPTSRYSSRIFDTKDSPSDRGYETKDLSSSRVVDPKGLSSPRGSDSRVETPVVDKKSKPDKNSTSQAPLSSPGVQDLLNDMPTLKVTAREVKPIQIQTKAEKDYGNVAVEMLSSIKATNTFTTETKLPADNKTKRVHKPPKPLPRKRTKTPPARGSGNESSTVVTSSQQNVETKSSGNSVKDSSREQNKDSEIQTQSTKQVTETSAGLGTKAYDSILRKNKGGKKSGKKVSLDPHAVLLHASLEGELELVKNIIHQVEDPSYPNNEGLTALHHAVCNSHDDIVKFLIEYGCDINAADMQGWTSLHCAAANSSVDMCKFLINHGACVFAVTAIEGKTPSRCCEKDSENFEECFTYLSDIENNFGISNEGVVYAVYAYQANRKDELSFECGESLTVVRRGDVNEKDWWWARDTRHQFGYIPRNLLGLHPPVAPDV